MNLNEGEPAFEWDFAVWAFLPGLNIPADKGRNKGKLWLRGHQLDQDLPQTHR